MNLTRDARTLLCQSETTGHCEPRIHQGLHLGVKDLGQGGEGNTVKNDTIWLSRRTFSRVVVVVVAALIHRYPAFFLGNSSCGATERQGRHVSLYQFWMPNTHFPQNKACSLGFESGPMRSLRI